MFDHPIQKLGRCFVCNFIVSFPLVRIKAVLNSANAQPFNNFHTQKCSISHLLTRCEGKPPPPPDIAKLPSRARVIGETYQISSPDSFCTASTSTWRFGIEKL